MQKLTRMSPLRWLAFATLALSAPILIAACNLNQGTESDITTPTTKKKKPTTPSDTEEDPTETEEEDDGGTCDLKKSGINFSVAACQTCMQAKCCFETRACAKGGSKCLDLQKCLLACPATTGDAGTDSGAGSGNGTGGGNGMGGGKGVGSGDGGGGGANACVNTCNAQFPNVVTKQRAYNDCATTGCLAECK